MRKTIYSLFIVLAGLVSTVNAQRICGSAEHLNQQLQADPNLAIIRQQIENQTAAYVASHQAGAPSPMAVITIPVVFHVVYNTAAQNVSDALCQAQVDQLNLDYAHQNTDATSVPAAFASVAANTNIQFCLASTDPSGNPTTGIERRQTTTTSFSTNDGVKNTTSGGMNAWPNISYLNIWTCNMSGGILGYAQFPGGSAATDGVVLLNTSVGSMASPAPGGSPYDFGRTATHEVGHWLNMIHIWGDANCGNDQVSDTPLHNTANYGCPTYPSNSTCTGSPAMMTMNYMDYTDDACMYMFTAGQATRMNALFATGGARVSLLSSTACQITALPACNTVTLGSVTVSSDTLCTGQTAVFNLASVTSGVSGVHTLWQTSADGLTGWNAASGSNTGMSYTAPAAPGVVYYRNLAMCDSSGTSVSSTPIPVYTYGISSIDNDTVCTAGAVDLIANGFGTVSWYATSTSTTPLATGNPFNINVIGDTLFYAGVSSGASTTYTVGPVSNAFSTAATYSNWGRGERFTALADLVIDSVSFYPYGAGNVVVNMLDSVTGTTVHTATFAVSAGQVGTKVTVFLGFTAAAGTNYIMTATGSTVSGLSRNQTGASYPYTVPGVISINRGYTTATSYYFFYDWKLHNGCTPPRVAVPVHVGPLNVQIQSVSDTICANGAATLTTSGANTYVWMPGNLTGSSVTVSPATTTEYTVTGTAAGACTGTSTYLVTIIPQPTVALSASNLIICKGSPTTLTASGANTYGWSTGTSTASSIIVTPTVNTSYTVTGTIAGCSNTASVLITVSSPTVAITASSDTICKGNSANLVATGGATYSWSPGGLTGSSITVSPSTTTTYTVSVKDANGCTATKTILVVVIDCGASGIASTNLEESFNVYPNPAQDELMVRFVGVSSGLYTLTLTDALGRTLQERSVSSTGNEHSEMLSLADLSKGVYVIRLIGNGQTVLRKIVKM